MQLQSANLRSACSKCFSASSQGLHPQLTPPMAENKCLIGLISHRTAVKEHDAGLMQPMSETSLQLVLVLAAVAGRTRGDLVPRDARNHGEPVDVQHYQQAQHGTHGPVVAWQVPKHLLYLKSAPRQYPFLGHCSTTLQTIIASAKLEHRQCISMANLCPLGIVHKQRHARSLTAFVAS